MSACRERTGPATKCGASARRVATCVLRGMQAKSAKQRAGHERRLHGTVANVSLVSTGEADVSFPKHARNRNRAASVCDVRKRDR